MFEVTLVVAALLVALVAGFLFAFAVVAMPGLEDLDDRAFLKAFQVMDRVIQDNQPLFMVVWVGSVIAIVAAAVVGFSQLDGLELVLLVTAAVGYVVGVQVPTAVVNIPLNNRLQSVDLEAGAERDMAAERQAFEARWNRWNRLRTSISVIVTALLLTVLLRI